MTTKPTIDITDVKHMLTTRDACKLTGLNPAYLRKLHKAGLLTPFKGSKRGYGYWRRDELIEALGFTPVTNTCPTKQTT